MVTSHSSDGAIQLSVDSPARHAPLDGFPEPPPWMADAVCATTDPEAFFPEKGGSTREAKAICARCSVQAECLDWALDRDERFGIYGGLSERERRRIKRTMPGPPIDNQHDPAIHDSTTQETA